MKCTECGYGNEADSNFCRQCGSKLTIMKSDVTKNGQIEFVSGKQRSSDDNLCFGEEVGSENVGYIFGAILICLGIFITIVMIFPADIGDFFGNFGEVFGNLGSDIGNFFGEWGDSFGNSVGDFFTNLFTESNVWDIIKLVLPSLFIIGGIIVIVLNMRRR